MSNQQSMIEKIVKNDKSEYAKHVAVPILRKRDEFARIAVKEADRPGLTQAQYRRELRKAHARQSQAWRDWMCEEHPNIAAKLGYSGEPPF